MLTPHPPSPQSVYYGNGKEKVYQASDCSVINHDEIQCYTVPGSGSMLHWIVNVEGQSSDWSTAYTSYAPPSVTRLEPASQYRAALMEFPPCQDRLSVKFVTKPSVTEPSGSTEDYASFGGSASGNDHPQFCVDHPYFEEECESYAPGQANAPYCESDCQNGICAKDVCRVCGMCIDLGGMVIRVDLVDIETNVKVQSITSQSTSEVISFAFALDGTLLEEIGDSTTSGGDSVTFSEPLLLEPDFTGAMGGEADYAGYALQVSLIPATEPDGSLAEEEPQLFSLWEGMTTPSRIFSFDGGNVVVELGFHFELAESQCHSMTAGNMVQIDGQNFAISDPHSVTFVKFDSNNYGDTFYLLSEFEKVRCFARAMLLRSFLVLIVLPLCST